MDGRGWARCRKSGRKAWICGLDCLPRYTIHRIMYIMSNYKKSLKKGQKMRSRKSRRLSRRPNPHPLPRSATGPRVFWACLCLKVNRLSRGYSCDVHLLWRWYWVRAAAGPRSAAPPPSSARPRSKKPNRRRNSRNRSGNGWMRPPNSNASGFTRRPLMGNKDAGSMFSPPTPRLRSARW